MGEASSQGKIKKNWFKGLLAEFKKIIWPDRKSVAKQTLAVVIICLILGALISVLDMGIQYGVEFISNLGL